MKIGSTAAFIGFAFAIPSGAAFAAQPADIIIQNAQVLTIDAERRMYPGGTVVIQGGRIVAVGGAELADDY